MVLRKYIMEPGGMIAWIISERWGRRVSGQRCEPGIRVVAPLVDVKGSRDIIVPIPINGLGLGRLTNPSSVCMACSLDPGPIVTV